MLHSLRGLGEAQPARDFGIGVLAGFHPSHRPTHYMSRQPVRCHLLAMGVPRIYSQPILAVHARKRVLPVWWAYVSALHFA